MASVWVSTRAGRHLAKRAKQDTAPEVQLRRVLHAQGARFRLHRRVAKGCTPDIVFPKARLAIFVDGCFWHGCPEHGRKSPWVGPNASLWAEKMQTNAQRDAHANQLASDLGWQVLRIWECQIRRQPSEAAARVMTALTEPLESP